MTRREAIATRKRRVLLPVLALAGVALGGGLATGGANAGGRPAETAAGTSGRMHTGAGVDPRAGGFEIGLGEWAVTAEARALRPGRVTFVIRNRGKFRHGFEIELRRADDDAREDEGAESIELTPGQSTRMTLELAPGVYEIECSVGDHDDLGMRGVLEVRADAPLVAPRPAAAREAVEIAGFAFKPATLRTTVGSVVTWRNSDAAPHTATGKQFSSPQLGRGGSFRHRFTRPGTYAYLCALHPAMRGRVIVGRRSSP